MRLILVGVVLLLAVGSAQAAESFSLGRHTVACRSTQDIIDLDIKNETTLQKIFPPLALALKYSDETCREYTAGTAIEVDKETSAQGLDLQCIKTKGEDRCFWALK